MAGRPIRIAILASAAKAKQAFDDTAKAAKKAGGKIESTFGDAFSAGLATAGVAAGAALVGGVFSAIDQEASGAQLAARLGLTGPAAAEAGKVAGSLYSQNFGDSLAGVNDAVVAVQGTFGDIAKVGTPAFEEIAKSALTLSDVMGVDVTASTKAAQQLIANGLAPDAQSAFDLITSGFQDGLNQSDDFLETLTEYSPQFTKLGIDGPAALSLLSAGLRAGARDTDVIADAFKEFSLRAIDGSDATVQAYKDLGLNAKQSAKDIAAGGESAKKRTDQVLDSLLAIKDPVKQNQIGVALFGTQWEDTLRQILPAIAAADTATQNFAGSTQKMADQVGGTNAAKIETFKRGLQQGLVQVLGQLAGFAIANQSWLVPFVAVLGTLAAVIGTIVAIMRIWTAVTTAYTAVQAALNVVLALNPIGLIIIAIVALVAAIVIAYKKSETFRKIVDGAFRGALKVITAVWNWIKANWPLLLAIITGPIGLAIRWVVRNFDRIVAKVRAVKDRIRDAFRNANRLLVGAGRAIVQGLWNGITGLAGWLRSKVSAFIAATVPGPIRDALGIGSPSRVMADLARWVPEGVALGITKNARVAESAARDLAQSTSAAFNASTQGTLLATNGRLDIATTGSDQSSRVVTLRFAPGRGGTTDLDRALWAWFKKNVDVKGGGSVQFSTGR